MKQRFLLGYKQFTVDEIRRQLITYNLNTKKIKIYGSFVTKTVGFNDINLVTYDKTIYNTIRKEIKEIHSLPIKCMIVKKDIFDRFQDLQSFYNWNVCYDLDGNILYGENYRDDYKVVMNLNTCFKHNQRKAGHHMKRLNKLNTMRKLQMESSANLLDNVRNKVNEIFHPLYVDKYQTLTLGGGFIRDLVVNKECKDINLYILDREEFDKFCNELIFYNAKELKKFRVINRGSNIKIIRKFLLPTGIIIDISLYDCDSVYDIADLFDFTINMCNYFPCQNKLIYGLGMDKETFIEHIYCRTLMPNINCNMHINYRSYNNRILKFKENGFKMNGYSSCLLKQLTDNILFDEER